MNKETCFVTVHGRRLALTRAGEGSPIVVLETGLGAESAEWDQVQMGVAQFTQVCCYDRAGRGQSDPGPLPRSARDMVADLHALLPQAGLLPPYVLVGQSLGGVLVRLYAHLYPHEVAGLVLVDPTHEDQFARIGEALPPESPADPEGLRRFRQFWTQDYQDPGKNMEGIDFPACFRQVREAQSLGDLPLQVLTSTNLLPELDGNPGAALRLHSIWRELHGSLARLSRKGTQVLVQDSGHFIQRDQPEAVIRAIRQVVESVRE